MLAIVVPGEEYFDETKEEFVTVGDVTIELEHSLAALSKWESKYKKPFLADNDKTPEEIFGYIVAMLETPNVSREVLSRLSKANIEEIQEYINDSRTATWFSYAPKSNRSQTLTSELVYSWMVALKIPMECQNWHLSRLFTLIRICDNNQNPNANKMSKADIMRRNRELNEKRLKMYNTTG